MIEITRERYSNYLLLDIPKKRLENFWRLIFIAGKKLMTDTKVLVEKYLDEYYND